MPNRVCKTIIEVLINPYDQHDQPRVLNLNYDMGRFKVKMLRHPQYMHMALNIISWASEDHHAPDAACHHASLTHLRSLMALAAAGASQMQILSAVQAACAAGLHAYMTH